MSLLGGWHSQTIGHRSSPVAQSRRIGADPATIVVPPLVGSEGGGVLPSSLEAAHTLCMKKALRLLEGAASVLEAGRGDGRMATSQTNFSALSRTRLLCARVSSEPPIMGEVRMVFYSSQTRTMRLPPREPGCSESPR